MTKRSVANAVVVAFAVDIQCLLCCSFLGFVDVIDDDGCDGGGVTVAAAVAVVVAAATILLVLLLVHDENNRRMRKLLKLIGINNCN